MTDLVVPGVPFPLEPSGDPACQATVSGGSLILTSGAKSDLFIDPEGGEGARPDAGRLTGLPGDLDFTLSARVTVRFGSVFDAGAAAALPVRTALGQALLRAVTAAAADRGHRGDPRHLRRQQLVRDRRRPLWLRITRSGRAWAFHASEDGAWWRLLRYFTLGEASGARVGFLAQSPTGPGCTAVFEEIACKPGAPADLRDGS